MSATQKVGQEIRRVRTGMGLSQKEFGELIGKSESQDQYCGRRSFQNRRGSKNFAGRADNRTGGEGRKNRMGCRTPHL